MRNPKTNQRVLPTFVAIALGAAAASIGHNASACRLFPEPSEAPRLHSTAVVVEVTRSEAMGKVLEWQPWKAEGRTIDVLSGRPDQPTFKFFNSGESASCHSPFAAPEIGALWALYLEKPANGAWIAHRAYPIAFMRRYDPRLEPFILRDKTFRATAENAPRIEDSGFQARLISILERSSANLKAPGTSELSFAGDANSCRVPQRARADPVYMGDADVFGGTHLAQRERDARTCNTRSFLIRSAQSVRFLVVYNGPWPANQPASVTFDSPHGAEVTVVGLKRSFSDNTFKIAAEGVLKRHHRR